MQSTMSAELVMSDLGMVIWHRGVPDQLIHHSDQGSQYTGAAFQKMLTDLGIECCLCRRGECHDNAMMESFYGTMMQERQCSNISKVFTCPIDGIRPWVTKALPRSKNRCHVLNWVSGILGVCRFRQEHCLKRKVLLVVVRIGF
jgi:transposase InsO family protein